MRENSGTTGLAVSFMFIGRGRSFDAALQKDMILAAGALPGQLR
jgi:hypothetical protein